MLMDCVKDLWSCNIIFEFECGKILDWNGVEFVMNKSVLIVFVVLR